MAIGRIRRSARRGLAAAILGWLGVAALAVLLAPSASAASTATVEIKNVTPPVASVDKGGQVTFINRIPAENRGGITVSTLPLVADVTASATVYTDVAVSFFGQDRKLETGQSTAWTFNAPATPGTITYTYRIVPQAGLAAAVATQVVDRVASQLPALPAPIPYVVQTVAPNLPQLPGVNLPQLPTVNVPLPLPPATQPPVGPAPQEPPVNVPPTGQPAPVGPTGPAYTYDTGVGAPRLAASDIVAAAAFDPTRYYLPGHSLGGVDRAGSASGSGSGGVAGSYDGASVPVFGELAGLDRAAVEETAVDEAAAADGSNAATLPAAALAAIVALAAVTAALVRTHQASRASR
ncbi:MAG: hypothetical protein JWP33_885 [Blastococcus sp.]|jgi:hypothetical protein|nr:hypothetical protein [Blastococcus sp.]